MAPLVVKNKVIVGISGGEYGFCGFIEALDDGTGDSVCTAYSIGPDKDVLIGTSFKPHYPSDKGNRSQCHPVTAGCLEARRLRCLGLRFVRPRAQSDLLRCGQSRSLECEPASGRQ